MNNSEIDEIDPQQKFYFSEQRTTLSIIIYVTWKCHLQCEAVCFQLYFMNSSIDSKLNSMYTNNSLCMWSLCYHSDMASSIAHMITLTVSDDKSLATYFCLLEKSSVKVKLEIICGWLPPPFNILYPLFICLSTELLKLICVQEDLYTRHLRCLRSPPETLSSHPNSALDSLVIRARIEIIGPHC
jgi:hypothetical protein